MYSARSRSIGTLARVFGTKYRAAVHRTAPYILVMAGLLVVIVIASALWVAMSRQAQAGILPPAARDAIQRAGGHRANLGIPPPGLATEILLNNVSVAFLAFAFGITLGIGTIWVVVQNALLLGVLAGAFQAAGHGAGFWALILPHGVLELTAICIAAGAGLRIGWSIVAPGDRPRGSALAEEARDAVLVVVGVVPAFGIAAIVEAFVTGTSIPVAAQLALGATLAAGYVLFLFGWRRSPRTLPPRHSRPADLMRR